MPTLLLQGACVSILISLPPAHASYLGSSQASAASQVRATSVPSARPLRELNRNAVISETHTGVDAVSYVIKAKAGEFIRVVLHPSAADLELVAYDPRGALLAATDNKNRRYGSEPLSFIAVQRGTYRLEVRWKDPAPARSFTYRLELAQQRRATSALRQEVQAERALLEGLSLSGGIGLASDAEQLRKALDSYAEAGRLYRAAGNEHGESEALAAAGFTHYGLDSYADAIASLQSALAIKRRIGDRLGEAAAVNDLGWSFYRQGGKQKALECYDQAIALARETGDRQTEAWARSNRGLALNDLGNREEAEKEFQASLRLHREITDRRGERVALNNLSIISENKGDSRGAIDLLQRALSIDREMGIEDKETAQVLLNISNNFTWLGDVDSSSLYSQLALEISTRVGSKHHQGSALLSIAANFHNKGEYHQSLPYKQRALAIFRETGNRSWEAATRRSLGRTHFHLGEFDKALEEYNAALSMMQAMGDRVTDDDVMMALGDAFVELQQPKIARGWYGRALDAARSSGDRHTEVQALIRLGRLSSLQGLPEEATKHLEPALALAHEMGASIPSGDALLALGDLARTSGNHTAAAERYARALSIYARAVAPERRAKALLSSGLLAEARGEAANALTQYSDALRLARQVQTPTTEALVLSRMMVLANANGTTSLAVFYGKQAVNVFQSVRSNITALDRETQRSFADSKAETYRNLAELLITLGRLPEAQQVLELLKEEEYFDFIRRNEQQATGLDKRAELTPEEAELDRRYRAIADDLAALGFKRGTLAGRRQRTADEERQLAELDAALNLAGTAFQRFLDGLAAEFRAEQRDTDRLFQVREAQGLMQTLRELGPGTVAVYTLVGREKLRILLITPDVQKAAEYTIRAADLNRLIFDFRIAAQDPRRDPFPAAQKLYNALVRPIQRDLIAARAKTIMWSLDGALRYVPVSALHDGQRFLVERFSNVFFTPASQSRLKDEPSRSWRGLGLGVSKRIEPFPELPLVMTELQSIIRDERAASGGVVPGRLILDEAFTVAAMQAELRKQYSLVHIATHFVFESGNDTSSFLLLGDGRRLSLAEVKRMNNLFQGVELLTLSACNTAVGDAGADGREVEGFALLAQRQGAKSVLASLWAVGDASTASLMRAFYEARAEKSTSKIEALRRSQLAMLNGSSSPVMQSQRAVGGLQSATPARSTAGPKNASTRHPFYWAPFILVGNWK